MDIKNGVQIAFLFGFCIGVVCFHFYTKKKIFRNFLEILEGFEQNISDLREIVKNKKV